MINKGKALKEWELGNAEYKSKNFTKAAGHYLLDPAETKKMAGGLYANMQLTFKRNLTVAHFKTKDQECAKVSRGGH